MEESKSEFLNEIAGGRATVTDEEFATLKQFVEQRDHATVPATPMEDAPAPSMSIGMFMPSTVSGLRGRENLETLLTEAFLNVGLCKAVTIQRSIQKL